MPGIETAARRHQNIIRASSKERKKTITTESHFKQIRWENFFDFFFTRARFTKCEDLWQRVMER